MELTNELESKCMWGKSHWHGIAMAMKVHERDGSLILFEMQSSFKVVEAQLGLRW